MTDPAVLQAADEVFGDVCTHEALQAAEADGWAALAWKAVAGTGLPWVGVPEEAGGQGGDLEDALAVLRVAGRHSLPLPLAETGVLGGWLLASAGLEVPAGPVTVLGSVLTPDGGTVERVPWGRSAERLVGLVLVGDVPHVVSLAQDDVRVEHRTGLSGEPRDTVHVGPLDDLRPAGEGVDVAALRLRGALTRVCLMAGALERLQTMTVRYTGEREQFGKPIGRFQAVQQHLVHVAQQAAMLGAAAEVAGRELARGGGALEVACA
jgi:acyl-CoA dehydrogenase